MGKVEDWLSAVPAKATRKTYKAGIKKFEEFYGNGIETLIGKSGEETGRIIDKFYVWLIYHWFCGKVIAEPKVTLWIGVRIA